MRIAPLIVLCQLLCPTLALAGEDQPSPEADPAPASEPAPQAEPEPAPSPPPATFASPVAVRASSAPAIDGDLSDAAWAAAPVFDGFVLNEPTEGGPGSERTEMRILYDDRNVYVSFRCFDSQPATINASLARRDTEPASDFVVVFFSPANDRRTGRRFYINAGGVLADSLVYDDSTFGQSWDAVWRGAAGRFAGGWTAEMAVPTYLVGMFDSARPTWGFLARRYIPRTHERVGSTLIPRAANGLVSRFGTLSGVESIGPRHALELLPYMAVRSMVHPAEDGGGRTWLAGGDLGLDLAYTFGRGLTVNGTFNPDFGQVEADEIVVNVTSFETFFPEKRPFFTQGLDLFEPVGGGDSNGMNLFYSRRIGRAAPILAAAKLTGAPLPGFQLGFLDAVVSPTRPLHGETDEEAATPDAPSLNYLAAVARAGLGSDSWVGARVATATPITDGAAGGNAVAVDTTVKSADGDYALLGQAAASAPVGGPEERTLLDGTVLSRGELGFGTFTRVGKYGGEPWRAELGYDYISPELDLNATGFQRDSNRHYATAMLGWQRANGLGPLHGFFSNLRTNMTWSADGRGLIRERQLALNMTAILPGFHTADLTLMGNLGGHDLREVRGTGVAVEGSPTEYTRLALSSDTSKVLSLNTVTALGHWNAAGPNPGRFDWTLGGGVVVRPSAAFETRLDVTGDRTLFSPRFVAALDGDSFLFGRLDYLILSATLRQQWAVTRDLTFQGYLQLFTGFGDYGPFFTADGTPDDPITQTELMPAAAPMEDPDFHTTQLAVNLIARWEYRPGSTIFLVYTRSQSELPEESGRGTLGSSTLFRGPAIDVLSFKWTWFWSG